MAASVIDKAERFVALHDAERPFFLPNAWDPGSARMLEQAGAPAIGTSSAALAFALGLPDGAVPAAAVIENARQIAEAVSVPVSADLLDGFGPEPDAVAETVRRAAEAGLAGCSIEDTTGDAASPLYPMDRAVARVEAATAAARRLDRPFVLTARADALFCPRIPDKTQALFEDAVARLQAFARVGADVVYAPGLTTAEQISAVRAAVAAPLNVLATFPGLDLDLDAYRRLGVRRLSVGSSLYAIGFGAAMSKTREFLETGRITRPPDAIGYGALMGMMARSP